jgi:hypothetical protein
MLASTTVLHFLYYFQSICGHSWCLYERYFSSLFVSCPLHAVILLNILRFCLYRNAQSKQYAPYGVIRTALMGYLHESMQNCGTALEHYARGGCLIEQRRLMFCLVQQFLGAF